MNRLVISKMKTLGTMLAMELALLAWAGIAPASEMQDAVRAGDAEKVKALLKADPDLLNEQDERGLTPLHIAAASGHKEVVQMLLASKAAVDVKGDYGSTPLHVAAAKGQREIVEMLLSSGADVNAVDKQGQTPLTWALDENFSEVAAVLRRHGGKASPKTVLNQWRVAYTHVSEPKSVVCSNGTLWEKVWQHVQQKAPAPLETNQLGIVIFMGQRPTGGYGLEVLSSAVTSTNYVIKYEEVTPQGFVTEAVTTPAVFALVPWTNLQVKLIKEEPEQPDRWIQQYYRNPSPDKFATEVRLAQKQGFLSKEGACYGAAGFFARLFAAHETRVQGWMSLVNSFPAQDRKLFFIALRWADTPKATKVLERYASEDTEARYCRNILTVPSFKTLTHPTADELDGCWGSFFATGDKDYVLTVIRCATTPHEPGEVTPPQYAARWSLRSLCQEDTTIARIKGQFYQTASAEQRRSLDELFSEDQRAK
jgi:hypothetical protein